MCLLLAAAGAPAAGAPVAGTPAAGDPAAGTSAYATNSPVPSAGPLVIKKEGNKFGLVNERGKQVLPPRYDSLQYTRHNEHYIAYMRQAGSKQQAGLINAKGKELIPIRFARVSPISPSRYAVTDHQKKVALFNEFGEAKTPFAFDEITAFFGKLARFYQNGRAGVLDTDGTIRLEAQYQDVIIHSDQTVDALPLRKWAITDGNNKLLYTLQYDSIRPLGEDRWAATTRFYDSVGRPTTMTALTDASGSMLIPYRAMKLDAYQEGVARVEEKGRFGLLDLKGNYVLPAEWDSLGVAQGTVVAGMRIGGNWYWHLFDLKGNKLSRHTYQNIIPLAEGLLPAKREGRWGYIDASGQETLLCRYDTTFAFTGELARVRYNGLEGVINKEGLWQIRPFAEHITIIDPYRFVARLKQEYQLLNEKGEVLYSTPYVLKPILGGIAEINPSRQWGLLDLNGKRLTPTEYDWISDVQEATMFFAVKEGKKEF
ncbi:WG repeat-containing protein [Cesiribacter andamanensis]|uniref:KWG Leptospira n=1 Tax=Cesiribacter andamanensis AMV16 TaxID=1279009 RepID=M7NRI6_9BACT|nr:WG repeat-containing protein [Cesiribacter andamanensis]EMR04290.1 KWG Leptospira [Cesiribacter andamanensis AMV16]